MTTGFGTERTVCPYCGVGCSLQYSEQSGTAAGWEGPVNTRGELCPKGVTAFEPLDADDRLTTPQIRENGELRDATWDEALSLVADRFTDAGPESCGFFASSQCTNEENYVLQRAARLFGTNDVDNCARLCHSSTVAAMSARFGAGAMTNTLDDLIEADAYLVVGANPAANHPIIWQSYLAPAVTEGTALVHVDPRANNTTKPVDVHLPVDPGHDIPLLNGLAAAIVEADRQDDAFLAERVTNVDAYLSFIQDVDVAESAALAGVNESDLREAARIYAEADRAAAFTGMGMSQHHCGTQNVHALINLALLTGNVGKRGTGINPLRGQNNVQGAGDVGALPNVLPGYQPVTDTDAREHVADAWGAEPPADPGLTEVEMLEQDDCLYVFGENPAVSEPNQRRARTHLQDTFVVVHDVIHSETVDYADVVLPGSGWAEKSGTVTNTDRQVMRVRQTRDPPGDARQDLAILGDLGDRLTDRNFEFTPESAFAELTEVSPIHAGMRWDAIGDGSLRWPFPEGASEGAGVLHEDEFATGDRRTDLRRIEHVPPADELGDGQLVLTTGRVIQHFNTGALTRRSDTLVRMRGSEVLQVNPDDAADRGIEDGDLVRVSNDRGELDLAADVTDAIRPGTVFCTFHYEDPLANRLTRDDPLDPEAKIPEYKVSTVTVERAQQ